VKSTVSKKDFLEEIFGHLILEKKMIKLTFSYLITLIPGCRRLIKDPMVDVIQTALDRIG
jgi:hypothetical protein